MTHYRKKYFLMVLFAAFILSACKKQWSQRDSVVDQQLNVNLFQQIQANTNLSTFAGYITKIGFDKVLSASKTYTVFAPTNAALASIDPATVADTAKLHIFVANHILNQAFLTANIGTSTRLHNLNGKNLTFTPTTIQDANITTADQYVNNGVLDIIDKALTPRLNIDQYIRSLTGVGAAQQTYILRNDSTYTDTTKATVASINPTTGKPILVPNTGQVTINKYYNRVAKLNAEDSLYTYIVLTDAALTNEENKVSKYFATSSVDTTVNILAGFNVLKDVAIRGVVQPANLPSSLTSVNGVPVPINQAAIVQSYTASNGIVYVMSAVNFDITTKITPITIQGELASFYKQSATNQLRLRNDNNGVPYRDVFTQPAISAYFAAYKLSNLYTCQYKVVLRAINDTAFTHIPISPQNPAAPTGYTAYPAGSAYTNYAVSERIEFGEVTQTTTALAVVTPTFLVAYPYQNVPPYFYAEITQAPASAVGTIPTGSTIDATGNNLNVKKYRSINMYVVGQTVTTANLDDILVDYVRLIPILQ